MTRITLACAAALFASLLLAGCNGSGGGADREGSAKMATVTGTVTYLQRVALPPDAELRVALEDISPEDASARTVASTSIVTEGKQVPIPFAIDYDPDQVDASHTYSIQAEIWVGGERRFVTTEAYPVITRDAPSHADVTVMALEKPRAATPLVGTYWKLASIGDMQALPAADARREPHLTLLAEENRAVATGGCNQMSGRYQITEQGLVFSEFVSTRMACPGVMEQEGALGRVFGATRGYRVDGTALELTDEAGAVLARFEAATAEEE